MKVYVIFMNGADKEWIFIREESWARLHGAGLDPKVIDDLVEAVDPEDVEEITEILENMELRQNDVAMNLPPIHIRGEVASFGGAKEMMEYATRHGLTVVDEFTCYT